MELENYQPIETPFTVSRTDIGVVARVNDEGKPVQHFEILLAKKDKIIVRALGARRASAPVKIEMPAVWDANGHKVGDDQYKFLKKPGVEIGPKSGKIKRVGRSREPGESKLDKCRAIFKANPNATRQDMLAKFVAEGHCTPAGANTYYLKIRAENT